MKRILLGIAVLGCIAFGAPQPAECVYCPVYPCYGPCGGDCVCVSPPGGGGGRCYGVERAPSLLERGWRVLE